MATRASNRGTTGAGTTGRIGGNGMRAINSMTANLQAGRNGSYMTKSGPVNRKRAAGGG